MTETTSLTDNLSSKKTGAGKLKYICNPKSYLPFSVLCSWGAVDSRFSCISRDLYTYKSDL